MRRISLIALFFVLVSFCTAGAAGWKELHEKADTIKFEDALTLTQNNPDSTDDLYVLGLVYLNQHKDKEALAVFEKILSFKPDEITAEWGRAEVLRRQHKYNASEQILEKIIASNPEFAPSYITLGYMKYREFKLDEAVRLAQRVIEMGRDAVDLSNYTRAYLLYGGTKGMIAHYGGAFSKIINGTSVFPNLKKAQKLQPKSAAVLFGMGSFYLLAPSLAGGDMEKAEEYLKDALEADPLFPDVYVRLAQVYKIKGDNDKYEMYLNQALEIDPKNELALDIKAGTCKFICP